MSFNLIVLTVAEAGQRGIAALGKPLYEHYCAPCHGLTGRGNERNIPALKALGITPRDHTQTEMQQVTDEELYRAIADGRVDQNQRAIMPGWRYTLTPEQIWHLIAYIRTLSQKDP